MTTDLRAALESLRFFDVGEDTMEAMADAVAASEAREAGLRAVADAALQLRDSGYDGPFIGDACEPLFAALALSPPASGPSPPASEATPCPSPSSGACDPRLRALVAQAWVVAITIERLIFVSVECCTNAGLQQFGVIENAMFAVRDAIAALPPPAAYLEWV